MEKKNFVALVWGVVAGLLFALGMCMCLLPEWNAFTAGVVLTAVGLLAPIVLLIRLRKASGKAPLHLSGKTAAAIALGIAGALVLGLGMCMIMLWDLLFWGIVVGMIGIVLLLCLIPVCVGLR